MSRAARRRSSRRRGGRGRRRLPKRSRIALTQPIAALPIEQVDDLGVDAVLAEVELRSRPASSSRSWSRSVSARFAPASARRRRRRRGRGRRRRRRSRSRRPVEEPMRQPTLPAVACEATETGNAEHPARPPRQPKKMSRDGVGAVRDQRRVEDAVAGPLGDLPPDGERGDDDDRGLGPVAEVAARQGLPERPGDEGAAGEVGDRARSARPGDGVDPDDPSTAPSPSATSRSVPPAIPATRPATSPASRIEHMIERGRRCGSRRRRARRCRSQPGRARRRRRRGSGVRPALPSAEREHELADRAGVAVGHAAVLAVEELEGVLGADLAELAGEGGRAEVEVPLVALPASR